jgi:chromosome segregation ATPase
MWFWWIVSLVILIASFIFIYRLFVTSYEFMPAGKKFFLSAKKDFPVQNSTTSDEEIIRSLKSKLQSMEESASFYEIQFSKFQQRLKLLEEQQLVPQKQAAIADDEEEDWKELYYEENERKEKLENELDETREQLGIAEAKLKSLSAESEEIAGLKSDYDLRLNDLQSMQNNIGLLQRQLEAAAGREKQLEAILLTEIELKKKYAQLESDHLLLKIQHEDLKRDIVKMNERQKAPEINIPCFDTVEKKDGHSKKKKKKG